MLRKRKEKRSLSLISNELIHNETNYILSPLETKLLTKGLNFIPTTRNKPIEIMKDLNNFQRLINLKLFWHLHDNYYKPLKSPMAKFIKSDFQPHKFISDEHPIWDNFTNQLIKDLKKDIPTSNCNLNDLKIWKDLINHKDFYILNADKGGKIVLWDRIEYQTEARRQLDDITTYQKLSDNQTKAFTKLISNKLANLYLKLLSCNNINQTNYKKLIAMKHKIPPIYFLPKIHKDKNQTSLTYVGRPIISACGGILKYIDLLITTTTSNLLKTMPGSITNTTDLLNKISELEPPTTETILFSADVSALYPNIPMGEGIRACLDYYSSQFETLCHIASNNQMLPPMRPDIFHESLSLVLKNNIFHFQNTQYFRQIKGTAMGASISVFYANTFMYSRTKNLIHNPPRELEMFVRYIDDIFGIYKGNPSNIEGCFSELVDENIKLNWTKSNKELIALDVLIYIEQDSYNTTVYTKPTDAPTYINWSSAHPNSLKKSIPYGQLLRLRRIISIDSEFYLQAMKLLLQFHKRGYPHDVLETALIEVKKLERKDLLIKKPFKNSDKLHCIFTYTSGIMERSKKHINNLYSTILQSDIITDRLPYFKTKPLPTEQPITTFRINKTIGQPIGIRIKSKDI